MKLLACACTKTCTLPNTLSGIIIFENKDEGYES